MRPPAVFLLLAQICAAQSNPAAVAARSWRQTHERAIVSEFFDLLSIPNLASDSQNIERNAQRISAMLDRRGIAARLLRVPGAPPVVYGAIDTPNPARTIVFYAHYDGQPLDRREWATDPWKPVLEHDGKVVPLPPESFDPESRIFARSASDDKAPVIALMAAVDALRAARIPLRSRIKFVFEGEEEAGSPHLAQILAANKELLAGDVWLICDGPVHQSRRPQIVFGARGIVTVDLTVYGPRRELHSGHYGNWAPNPAFDLARLLASMKDENGRVLIEHFYDGIEPLSPTERRALGVAPDVDAALERELWLGRVEGGGKRLAELINLPSLNVRGMGSARIGAGASNVVPATATAAIDMRLVKGITPDQAVERLAEHIRKQGWFLVTDEPDAETRIAHPRVARLQPKEAGYPAARTSMDLEISKAVIHAAESALGPVVKLPTMGGSVPLYMIEEQLGAPTITTPIANHDNNQHSFNENIRLQNLWDGIELMAALLAM